MKLIAPIALVLLLGCTTTTAQPNTADATVAVNARAAIDSIETLHVAACTWAITEHNAKRMTDAKYAQIRAACDAVASAEEIANAQLAIYLATGTLDAKKALLDALAAASQQWAALNAAKVN